MADTSFFTQAFNFISTASGGVDPRTGLFNVRATLGHLVGNNNLGPSLPLTLSYSPLTTTDIGFGIGVSLGLSYYDSDNHLLVLATGEQYKIVETDQDVNLQQQKLDTVKFIKDTQNDRYLIVRKSGDVEILKGPSYGYSIKVPVALVTPAGRCLTLDWDSAGSSNSSPRLSKVQDENDTLLTVEYSEDTKTTFHLLPDQSEGYNVELWFQNHFLSSIHNFSLGQDVALIWQFCYDTVTWGQDKTQWMSGMTSPGGMIETAYYCQDGQGHKFPDTANLPPLPYVYQFTQTPAPGDSKSTIAATYDYSDTNFVGGNSGEQWDPNSDYLYGVQTSYSYYSTETRTYAGQTRTIKRVYNSYHLQTDEITQQNGCTHAVKIDYYSLLGHDFDSQPAQFQLPQYRTVTWTDAKSNSYIEKMETDFDDAGNPTTQINPDGSRIDWEYYPAKGSGTDCPPEPNGFVRLLKRVIRTPQPQQTSYDAPVQTTMYRYAAYSVPSGSDLLYKYVSTAVLKVEEQHYSDSQLLHQTTFAYSTDQTEYGRLTQQIVTEYPDGSTGSLYSYVVRYDFAFSVQQDKLVQTCTLTTYNNLSTTHAQTRSRFTGRLWSSTDVQGNVTIRSYDGLGRLVTSTANHGTTYENTLKYEYKMDTSAAAPFTITATDANGNQVRNGYDGGGRPINRSVMDADGDGQWYDTQVQQYDEQGRLSCFTAMDYLRSNDAASNIQLTQTPTYDDWGQHEITSYSDGVSNIARVDPVNLTTTVQQTTVQQTGGDVQTGTEVTTYDKGYRPVSVARYTTDGTLSCQRTLFRDGWGRVRCDIDACGNKTQYTYDARGRLVRTDLPDGTKITRQYAAFSSDSLLTGIAVNDVSLGTRTFDGLGRVTQITSGGRTWSCNYSSASDSYPSSVVTPDGETRTYQYVPELNDALQQKQAGSITQKFEYDPITGSLLEAQAGATTLDRTYYKSGLLCTETMKLTGQPDRSAIYTYSVAGRSQSYTGVDGVVQQITWDSYGRVTQIGDSAMQVSLQYDAVNRLIGWTAKDLQSEHTLSTSLTLDDFNRETQRTITDSQGTNWKIAQTWQANDQLVRRVTTRDATTTTTTTLRDEQYTYDSRNRLINYTCSGVAPATDEYGNAITGQSFTYDAYSNVTQCQTQFSDGTSDTATYKFSNKADPCQLTGICHTHATYPAELDLTYDAAGRLTTDEAKHSLSYDELGRLNAVAPQSTDELNRLNAAAPSSQYGYDALDRLLSQQTSDSTSVLYYRGDTLAALIDGNTTVRLLHADPGCVAQHQGDGDQAETRLLGTDGKQSVLLGSNGQQIQEQAYTAYGSQRTGSCISVLGYNGERLDPATGVYHLGNGYRAYHPGLMRFTAPDSLSPFGDGGINPYAYCLGDPVNRADPSGHLSWQAWLGIGLGVASLVATVVTGGMAIAAAGGIMAAVSAASTTTLVVGAAGAASDVTAIASGALEEVSPKASSILGWISLGTGAVGAASAIGKGIAKGVSKLSSRITAESAAAAKSIERVDAFRTINNVVSQQEVPEQITLNNKIYKIYDREAKHWGWEVYERPGGTNRIYTTTHETAGPWIRNMVRESTNQNRDVIIFSGTHGSPWGVRERNYVEPRFTQEDWDLFEANPRVTVIDITDVSVMEIKRHVQSDADVFFSFCFSRNDQFVLWATQRNASTSFVRPI